LARDKGTAPKKRNYKRDLSRADRNCIFDIWTSALAAVVSAGFLLWLISGGKLPAFLDPYRYALLSAGMSALLYSMLKLFSGAADRRACAEIKKESVYAVRLKKEQQKQISRVLARQSMREHFLCYAAVLAVLAVMLVLSYIRSGNSSSLIVLAFSAIAGFMVTLLAYIKDTVRTASGDGFCTVSSKGIIQAGRVLPFRAAAGDVSEIVEFDDCYSVRFVTGGVLGLMVDTDIPLPKGGAVSREIIGAEEETVVMAALMPRSVRTEEGRYRQMPFRRVKETKQTGEDSELVLDSSLFLKAGAWCAAAFLIVSVLIAALR